MTRKPTYRELEKRVDELTQAGSDLKQTEKLRQRERDMLSSILDNNPHGMAVIDRSGEWIYVNPTFTEITGYTLADVSTGKQWFEKAYPDPEYRKKVLSAWKKDSKRIGKGEDYTFDVCCKDGAVKTIEFRTSYLEDRGISVLTDVSKRKSAEKFLYESKSILDNISDIVYVTDTNGYLMWTNPAAEKITGIPAKELEGRPFFPLFMEKDQQTLADVHNRALSGESLETTLTFTNKTTCHFTCLPLRDDRGSVTGTFGIARDITEKRKAEEALKESEERFRLTFRTSPDAIAVNRLKNGMYIDINDGFTNIMGYTWEDVEGKTSLGLNIWKDPEDRRRLVDGLKRSGYVENLEARFVGKDGKIREGLMSARVLRIRDENVILSITRDITEYKRTADEKARLEAQFRQAQKMEAIGTLAGGIAHDFNNILSPIIGYSELMKVELPPNSALNKYVDQILQAGHRARELVMQILTFSRQSEQEIRPMKLQPVIKEVLKLLRASIPTTIEIKSDIRDGCAAAPANPTQIHQIIMNLAANAFHAMEKTGGRLSVSLEQVRIRSDPDQFPDLEPGDYAVITVSDTGEGIKKELLDRVLDPYFTTKEKNKGTGLGLSVVQGIVKASRGTLRIASAPGEGTEVKVCLPVMAARPAAPAKDSPGPVTGGAGKILLADDDQTILDMTRQMLERLGYTVIARSRSPEAFNIFKADPEAFDLVITDMTMPDMTGLGLSEKMRGVRPDVPIIICTGFSEQISEEWIKTFGVQGLLMKPVTVREIAEAVRRALDNS